MGSFVLTRHSEHIFQAINMNTKLLLTSAIVAVSCIAFANAGQMFLLDDGDFEEHVRVKRSPQQAQRRDGPVFVPVPIADEKSDPYSPPIPYKAPKSYKKGRVGPVYTFVKTDPYANFKWGVRHVVGHKYGR